MLTVETIAMICYEACRVFEQSIGDYSTPKWCELSSKDIEGHIEIIEKIYIHSGDTILNSSLEDCSVSAKIKHGIISGITDNLANFAELESANVATTI